MPTGIRTALHPLDDRLRLVSSPVTSEEFYSLRIIVVDLPLNTDPLAIDAAAMESAEVGFTSWPRLEVQIKLDIAATSSNLAKHADEAREISRRISRGLLLEE